MDILVMNTYNPANNQKKKQTNKLQEKKTVKINLWIWQEKRHFQVKFPWSSNFKLTLAVCGLSLVERKTKQ